MPVGELRGVVQDQGKRFPVARKSLPCGTKGMRMAKHTVDVVMSGSLKVSGIVSRGPCSG
jgi:hypothetical protein